MEDVQRAKLQKTALEASVVAFSGATGLSEEKAREKLNFSKALAEIEKPQKPKFYLPYGATDEQKASAEQLQGYLYKVESARTFGKDLPAEERAQAIARRSRSQSIFGGSTGARKGRRGTRKTLLTSPLGLPGSARTGNATLLGA